MMRSAYLLLASAVLLAAPVTRAGAAQITLGETAGAVHQALGSPDVLSQYGGPPNSPTETYFSSGLDIQFLRGIVETISVRHTSPPMGLAFAQKARQAYVSVKRVGPGDAVLISIGETAHDVRRTLGRADVVVFNGRQTEKYFAAGLSVQYSHNKVAKLTVMRFVLPPKWRHAANAKFKQTVVIVPGY